MWVGNNCDCDLTVKYHVQTYTHQNAFAPANPSCRRALSTTACAAQELRNHADNKDFQTKWWEVKQQAKCKALEKISALTNIQLNPEAVLDIQVKRIHEYKRQLLNLLGIVLRYDAIKKATPEQRKQIVPKTCVIGGKAAPGYGCFVLIVFLLVYYCNGCVLLTHIVRDGLHAELQICIAAHRALFRNPPRPPRLAGTRWPSASSSSSTRWPPPSTPTLRWGAS